MRRRPAPPGSAPSSGPAAATAAPGRAGATAGGLVAVVFWGLAPVATRAVVVHLDPLPLLVIRQTVAALVLLLGERLTATTVAGGLVILAGVAAASTPLPGR